MGERIGIIMNGVTGRMGTNQHLIRSVLALRQEGGVRLKDGRRVLPEPINPVAPVSKVLVKTEAFLKVARGSPLRPRISAV